MTNTWRGAEPHDPTPEQKIKTRDTPSSPPFTRRTFFSTTMKGPKSQEQKTTTQNTPQCHLEMQATIRTAYRAVFGPVMNSASHESTTALRIPCLQITMLPACLKRKPYNPSRHPSHRHTRSFAARSPELGGYPSITASFDRSFAIPLISAFTKD
ncbi:hypothetical protein NA56DRAFT_77995 [Hyaloscypha hepaticicola]|uniref:Uncharacterized protein n=1 Tax=Hyaloscypha hepaticicola TaxID=2082293 RepID=A0A2J6Q9F8_9HELO|nr:hypothetical protein NA56DRAFT_77995 [Hyaloscypha hepaticicola]